MLFEVLVSVRARGGRSFARLIRACSISLGCCFRPDSFCEIDGRVRGRMLLGCWCRFCFVGGGGLVTGAGAPFARLTAGCQEECSFRLVQVLLWDGAVEVLVTIFARLPAGTLGALLGVLFRVCVMFEMLVCNGAVFGYLGSMLVYFVA